MLKVDLDARKLVAKLKVVARRIRVGGERAIEDEAVLMRDRIATRYWKNRTGYTAGKTQVERPSPTQRRVVVAVPWAKYLDEGTRPHVIEPKRAKALGPMMGGKFFRKVRHPGTKGLGFRKKEAASAAKSFARRMRTVVKNAIK